MIQAQLHERVEEGPGVESFIFQTALKLSYQAGQYTQLTLPHENPDERGISRWFSLSSSPSEPFLLITTRMEKHQSTFKETMKHLKPGAMVQITEPIGTFVLPPDTTKSLIFVAGGIGVTPYRSMIKFIQDQKIAYKKVTLLWSCRSHKEFIFGDYLGTVPFLHQVRFLTEPDHGWHERRGRITLEDILDFSGPEGEVYLAGPQPMAEELYNQLLLDGFPWAQMHLSYFPGYTEL